MKKYNRKISFFPVTANMYYAGPREAAHHAIIRKNLGFDIFTVGRDHAGAKNAYPPSAATELLKSLVAILELKLFVMLARFL